MMPEIPRMTVAEFRRLGLLQELNRLFLHPRGLALEVVLEDGGTERFGGVWDYRDDPEGMAFAPGVIDPEKSHRVRAMLDERSAARQEALGFVVQSEDHPGVGGVIAG